MSWKLRVCLVATLMIGAAGADTVFLKNGVEFDGVVTPVPENPDLFRVTAGKRSLTYRTSEIDRIEKNDKTGIETKEDILARWEERDRQLTEETGLTAEQRRLVRELMLELVTDNASRRLAVREKLVALQSEFDVFRYLAYEFPTESILIAPSLLEVMVHVDAGRAVEVLLQAAQSNFAGTRAMALELLGRLGQSAHKDLIAQGLADHKQEVQLAAIYALASLNVREATPALIGLLAHLDLRVSNASKEALRALWADSLPDPRPSTVDEWTAFWNSREKSGTPIVLSDLEPLTDPAAEIESNIDMNHGTPPPVEVAESAEDAASVVVEGS